MRQVFAVSMLVIAWTSAVHAEPGRRFAIIAGVEKYDHGGLAQLDFAEDDAVDLARLLAKVNYRVYLLSESAGKKNPSNAPTRANIDTVLRGVLDEVKRDDTVLVALSGHGLSFGPGDSYFCPQDAKPSAERTDTLVSLSAIYKQLGDSGAGVKVLLVDACRNNPDPGKGKGIDADTAPRPPTGVAVLFSCSRGERSFEHESLKHGVFTHFILEGLRGRARDGDDEVSFDSLALYVRKQTARQVPILIGDGRQQSPNLKADLSGVPAVLLTADDLAQLQPPGALPGKPKPRKPIGADILEEAAAGGPSRPDRAAKPSRATSSKPAEAEGEIARFNRDGALKELAKSQRQIDDYKQRVVLLETELAVKRQLAAAETQAQLKTEKEIAKLKQANNSGFDERQNAVTKSVKLKNLDMIEELRHKLTKRDALNREVTNLQNSIRSAQLSMAAATRKLEAATAQLQEAEGRPPE